MIEKPTKISDAFKAFLTAAPDHAKAWNDVVAGLANASALDEKTRALAYIAVLAALELTSGIPFHVEAAQNAGATRDEIVSAILIGLPAAGNRVTQALPTALEVLDQKSQ